MARSGYISPGRGDHDRRTKIKRRRAPIGLWAVRHVLLTLLALVVLLGIFWVVNGTIEVFTAMSHRGMQDRGWVAAMGVLSILAGLIVLIYPGPSLLTLSIVLGIWLLVYGIMEIMAGLRLRRLTSSAASRMAQGWFHFCVVDLVTGQSIAGAPHLGRKQRSWPT